MVRTSHVEAAGAQAAIPMTAAHGFVGSWRLDVFEDQGPPTLGLATLGADGTVVTAEHPVVTPPGAPGVIFTSSGHGAWQASGPDTAILTFASLGSDGTGNLFAAVTFRAAIALGPDGQTMSGEAEATIAGREGETLAIFPLKLQGRRIVPEAPAPSTAG
jgi:hypothetical protein